MLFDEEIFKYFTKKIKQAEADFKDVPGFLSRYKADDLIKLMHVLKNSSPKERLNLYNNYLVDKFLDYSFRAFLHAQTFKMMTKVLSEDEKKALKEYLKAESLGDSYLANRGIASYFLAPKTDFLFFSGTNTVYTLLLSTSAKLPITVKPSETKDINDLYQQNKDKDLKALEEEYQLLSKNYVYDGKPSKELDELEEKEYVLDILRFFKLYNINSLDELYNTYALRAFSYRSSENHVSFAIRKDMAPLFGF